jgi:hypothetical protein
VEKFKETEEHMETQDKPAQPLLLTMVSWKLHFPLLRKHRQFCTSNFAQAMNWIRKNAYKDAVRREKKMKIKHISVLRSLSKPTTKQKKTEMKSSKLS